MMACERGFFKALRLGLAVLPLVAMGACGGGGSEEPMALSSNGAGSANTEVLSAAQTAGLLSKAAELNTTELLATKPIAEVGPRPKAFARVPVYRFYNRDTTAHFYTTSEAERQLVQATMPTFDFEGAAFFVSGTSDAGLSPVFRFYNSQTGVHFYSISAQEKAYIQANLPQFTYEGIAYYASQVAQAGMKPLYRFLRADKGFHFYSASESEKDSVLATLPLYLFENVAYYVMSSQASGYTVGGTLSGLGAEGAVVLQINGGNDLSLSANGNFVFSAPVPSDGAYSVSITTQPEGQTCTVSEASGTASANVNSVVVTCSEITHTVGGSVSGLAAGQAVVLQVNGGSDLTRSANGAFTFVPPLAQGAGFSVTVAVQPVGQVCAVGSGEGTVTAEVSSVLVTCSTASYSVGGTVSGLAGGQRVRLRLNGAAFAVSANGAFAFPNNLAYGASFTVLIATQPMGQSCSLDNASGTVTGAVGNVQVVCSNVQYSVGGSLTGLAAGKTVVLQNNGGDDLSRSADGVFTFAGGVTHGSTYRVSVRTQPVGQVCTVSNGSGTATAAVSNVQVVCATIQYTVGGIMSGLPVGKTVVLRNTTGRLLSVTANGAFTFVDPVDHGGTYGVTVHIQPTGLSCSVSNGSGTANGAVSNVAVNCATNLYSVGGSLSGLGSGKSVVLQNNAGNDLTRSQNGNFAFTTLVPYGSPYAVSVRTQPVDQTCTVSNGLGTMAGQVSSVAITCADHVSVGGSVSGLIAGNPVVLTLNGGGDTSIGANGGFTFAGKTPTGATYVVGVRTQPRGQTCTVSNSTGTAIGAVGNVGVVCANNAPSDLLISEVGGCPWENYSGCWLEVYNPTSSTRNLSAYRLRSGMSTAGIQVFDLPSVTIAPGQYRILAANVEGDVPATALNPVVMLGDATSAPFWGGWSGNGLVELVSVSAGTTVDAVRFGSDSAAPNPATPTFWVGAPVSAGFVGGLDDQARSLVRPAATMSSQYTWSALDWVAVDYATPGGPNDVAPGASDADSDGIPDANEQPGATYNGLDLYSMGARTGQQDIFVEVDHMSSTKAGVIPDQASMQMVKNAFALRGFAVHIDVGDLFAANFDPDQFNLGQGNSTVPYQACLGFSLADCSGNSSVDYRTVYDWKWQHSDPRRRAVFHYALFGDAAATSSWGRAELFGNDFVVTMGNVTTASSWLTNRQASTFMHELGHNLGLQHGGDENTNYKPNYLSVMNYLKDGISPGNSIWPFVEWQHRFGSSSSSVPCYPGSTHPLCTADPAPFVVDYSNGSSLPLNESALYESANVGRGALPGVYADWDENGSLTTTAVARDLNADGVMGVLTDHNDWAALTLPFTHSYSGGLLQKSSRMMASRKAAKVPERGATVPSPMFDDRGPTIVTCGSEPTGAHGSGIKRGLQRGAATWRSQPVPHRR